MDEAKQSKKGIYRLLGTQPTDSVGRIKMDSSIEINFCFPDLEIYCPRDNRESRVDLPS